jgi:hypothetical protein
MNVSLIGDPIPLILPLNAVRTARKIPSFIEKGMNKNVMD